MQLIMFYKKGTKNIEIEYFKYGNLDTSLQEKIKLGIDEYEEKLNTYETIDYDPLAIEKGRKVVETLSLDQTKRESSILRLYMTILNNESYSSSFRDDTTNTTYSIKSLDSFHSNECPLSFIVIKHNNKLYFKKANEAEYFLKNKMHILTHVEEAKLKPLNDNYILLNTNFEFYIEESTIYVKSNFTFETICNIEEVYNQHRENVLENIEEIGIIENIEDFKMECVKKRYLRVFKKVDSEANLKESLSNKKFIDEMIIQTDRKIDWTDETKTNLKVDTSHVRTIIHLFSGLIGKDIYEALITFNNKAEIN